MLLVEWPRDRRRLLTFLTKAAIVGVAVTLPFVLWDPARVLEERRDAAVPSAVSRRTRSACCRGGRHQGHQQPPALISFVVAAAASALALWRLPRTPAGFSAAIAMTFFAFFVFNKQAFCNYYFFVVGALYASVAAWHAPEAIE